MGYCAQVYDHYISTFTNQFTLKVWFCSNNLDVQDASSKDRLQACCRSKADICYC